jgi:hypothetical protein
MNLTTIIVSFFSVIVAWGLTRLTDRFTDKKQLKKKHHKLLFSLLELRMRVNRVLDLESSINQTIAKLELAMEDLLRHKVDLQSIKPVYLQSIKEILEQQLLLPQISNDIDDSLKDLAEIDPVLSFRLLGQYQIAQKLQQVQNCMENMMTELDVTEFSWKDLLEKPILTDLSRDLEETIKEVGKLCGRATVKKIEELNKTNLDKENERLKVMVSDVFARFRSN